MPEIDVAPIISVEKFKLFLKRFLRTALGGLEFYSLFVKSERNPLTTYALQLILFFFPLLFVIPPIIIADFLHSNVAVGYSLPFSFGVLFAVFILLIDLYSFFQDLLLKKTKIVPEADEIFVEDDDHMFWKRYTKWHFFLFVVPPSSVYSIVVRFFFNALGVGFMTFNIVPARLMLMFEVRAIAIVYCVVTVMAYLFIQFQATTKEFEELSQIEYLSKERFTRLRFFCRFQAILFVCFVLKPYVPLDVAIWVCLVGAVVLPIAFALGLVPKFRFFLLFAMEFCDIHLLGGTASWNYKRTLFKFALSLLFIPILFVLLYFVKNHTLIILLSIPFAFILSWGPVLSFKKEKFKPKLIIGVIVACVMFIPGIVYSICLIAGLDFVIPPRFNETSKVQLYISYGCEAVVLCLYVLSTILSQTQRKFWMNIVSNPLYAFLLKKKSVHSILFFVKKVLSYILSVILLLYYIFLNYPSSSSGSPVFVTIIECMFTVRSFRRLLNNYSDASVEFLITAIIDKFPQSFVVSFSTKMAIVGYCVSKLVSFFDLLKYVVTYYVSIFFNKNLKFKKWKLVMVLNFVFIFVVLFLIFVESLVLEGMYLIPIFGIPVFFIGYPRMKRFWTRIGNRSECPDTTFYEYLEKSMKKKLTVLFQRGGCFDNLDHGSFVLIRSDPFIMLCQVLERNFDSVVLSFKGLELQTTSCHAAEATHFDEHFCEEEKKVGFINTNFFHIFEPKCEIFKVEGYSISNSKLVGIIDNPNAFTNFKEVFSKVLLYLIYRRNLLLDGKSSSKSTSKLSEIENDNPTDDNEEENSSGGEYSFLDNLVKNVAQSVKPAGDNQGEFSKIGIIKSHLDKDWLEVLEKEFPNENEKKRESDMQSFEEKCVSVVFPNVFLEKEGKITPVIVYEFFNKKQSNPFTSNSDLKMKCLCSAFHYSIKLILDMLILAEDEFMTDNKALLKSLNEMEENWRFGKKEIENRDNYDFSKGVNNVFNIDKDPEEKHIHRLIIHSKENKIDKMTLGTLNKSTVWAVWGNLNFEMIYVTSDDDERFSIQANKLLMNNILISAAEPPLGYPIHQAIVELNAF